MRLGLGFYRQQLTPENLRFARQAGASSIVAHLVDYAATLNPAMRRSDVGMGVTHRGGRLWTVDELAEVKALAEDAGLELAAVENFDPAHWHDVLLDGPRRDDQIADLAETIRRVGAVGIPCIGYCFTLAGVSALKRGPYARGEAETYFFDADPELTEQPIPRGQVWNMTYDLEAEGELGEVTVEQMWDRLERFLADLVPVAEEAGVTLAAHPDDPPVRRLRGTGRLLCSTDDLARLLTTVDSPRNALELCQGTIAEMAGSDPYEAIDRFSAAGRVAYVHLRNVRGTVPAYTERFLDEGDVDVLRSLRILRDNGFDGVLIPDHTPHMSCAAPWHAGMAFALGYMTAALRALG
jgi:mannonate dehydratase